MLCSFLVLVMCYEYRCSIVLNGLTALRGNLSCFVVSIKPTEYPARGKCFMKIFKLKIIKTRKHNIVCETWLSLEQISEDSCRILNPASFLYFVSLNISVDPKLLAILDIFLTFCCQWNKYIPSS